MENQQISAGAKIGLAIILGALIALFPGLVLWFAWLGVIAVRKNRNTLHGCAISQRSQIQTPFNIAKNVLTKTSVGTASVCRAYKTDGPSKLSAIQIKGSQHKTT